MQALLLLLKLLRFRIFIFYWSVLGIYCPISFVCVCERVAEFNLLLRNIFSNSHNRGVYEFCIELHCVTVLQLMG